MAQCSDCRFFSLVDDSVDGDFGICRRYAPKPSMWNQMPRLRGEVRGTEAAWPNVLKDDWCGEHDREEED